MITPPCEVESPSRAAGFPPIITVADPLMMVAGGPAQTQESPTRAAGKPPMSTTGVPAGSIGPPTCGVPPGVTAGQTCWSVIRAIGFIVQRGFASSGQRFSNGPQTNAGERTRPRVQFPASRRKPCSAALERANGTRETRMLPFPLHAPAICGTQETCCGFHD